MTLHEAMETVKNLLEILLKIEQCEIDLSNRRSLQYNAFLKHIQHCTDEVKDPECELCRQILNDEVDDDGWFNYIDGLPHTETLECIKNLKKFRLHRVLMGFGISDFFAREEREADPGKTSICDFYRSVLDTWVFWRANSENVNGHIRGCTLTGRDKCYCEYLRTCKPFTIITDFLTELEEYEEAAYIAAHHGTENS